MPLPFIIGGIALAAGAAGVKSGISGGAKIKDAKETMDLAKNMQARAEEKFEEKISPRCDSWTVLEKKN